MTVFKSLPPHTLHNCNEYALTEPSQSKAAFFFPYLEACPKQKENGWALKKKKNTYKNTQLLCSQLYIRELLDDTGVGKVPISSLRAWRIRFWMVNDSTPRQLHVTGTNQNGDHLKWFFTFLFGTLGPTRNILKIKLLCHNIIYKKR